MHRRPVPLVVAHRGGPRARRRTRGLGEQVDRRGGAQHLRPMRAQAASDGQPERVAVERNRPLQILHVDADAQLQGHRSSMAPGYGFGTNCQRAVTETWMVNSPGSMGVAIAAPAVIRARYIGLGPASAVESSSSGPRLPPAARAIASASPRAFPIASASACRRPASLFEEKKSRELIWFAPFASAASIT